MKDDDSRTDSTRQLVGVTDFSTSSRLLELGLFMPRMSVAMGLQMIASIMREEHERSLIRILCQTFGADDTLARLAEAAAKVNFGFPVPEVEDSLCVILPENRDEIHEHFDSYSRLLVIGADGLVAHVVPAGDRAKARKARLRESTLV